MEVFVHVDLNYFVVDSMFVLTMVVHLHHLMGTFQITMVTVIKQKQIISNKNKNEILHHKYIPE